MLLSKIIKVAHTRHARKGKRRGEEKFVNVASYPLAFVLFFLRGRIEGHEE